MLKYNIKNYTIVKEVVLLYLDVYVINTRDRAATMLKYALNSSQELSCLTFEQKFNISQNFSASTIGE
jgi:hypothetical protein